MTARAPLSWGELEELASALPERDLANGPTTPQSRLRLFGQSEEDVRVTLYRDNHAWCPYCQKVWLWLEEQRVPYRIQKVTMFCYGEKEAWYKERVPSGMLPALELDGLLVTESDVVLSELEKAFGPLHKSMGEKQIVALCKLERALFSAWCGWLCYPSSGPGEEERNMGNFDAVARLIENALSSTPGKYFLEEFSTADVVFTPYLERMNASLYYFKGYVLRDPALRPRISAWFDAMEARETYRGTQSDFHTHCHDLPPQMGGCYEASAIAEQPAFKSRIDNGPWSAGALREETSVGCPPTANLEAISRTVRHRENIIKANPADAATADEALRCALTYMADPSQPVPTGPSGADTSLRYIRDRICVPRDMSLHAAQMMRHALETVAATAGTGQGPPIPFRHRRDQDPQAFH